MYVFIASYVCCVCDYKYLLFLLTSDPASRPTFLELLEKLRVLQRQYNLQFKAARSASSESTQKEL